MPEICIVHGVGFHTDLSTLTKFAVKLQQKTGAICTFYRWQHAGTLPEMPNNIMGYVRRLRSWTHEVIMDFAHVIVNIKELLKNLPEADMYIGHSAGGVIVANMVNVKPVITMGCPFQLLKNVEMGTADTNTWLNMMHIYDAIAAPAYDACNEYLETGLWKYYLAPPFSHSEYWVSGKAMDKVVEWYGKWVG